MPFDPSPPASLASLAHDRLARVFEDGGHRPSTEQWAAIYDLLDHLEMAANRSVAPAVYVSAIPAGTGKTASIAAFAEALMDHPGYAGVGMLIAVNRVDEVRDMAEALAAHRAKLCVVVGKANPEVLAMGHHAEADAAQVVISTQAALRETLRTVHSFDNARRYHFGGAVRDVVCWDEAISFNRPVVLNGDSVGSLATPIRRQSPEAAIVLHQWVARVAGADGGSCPVPDFEALGVDFHQLEDAVSDRDEQVAQVRALAAMSGGTGWVIRENTQATAMVTAVPELPASLMPVFVTDASAARGVHHASYVQMATTRPVKYLKEATKTYRNLTVRIVPAAASRSVYRDPATTRGRDLIEMTARYVRSVAPADVLVVSYKAPMKMKGVAERTISEAITARLTPEERGRVRHLTYGNHKASNAHKHVRHVVLMGLNFLPHVAGYAASGAALNKTMRTADEADHPSRAQVDEMAKGMLRDSTLQAILRGNARMGSEGDCGEMEVVIPQVMQTGLPIGDYLGMFPEATVTVDTSLMPRKDLTGRAGELSGIIDRRLAAGDRMMEYPSLYEEMAMARQDFSKLVKRPDVVAWLTSKGLRSRRLKQGLTGIGV